MRVFNYRTETRDQCSIIHHDDENIEIWHSIDEDPHDVIKANQKMTVLGDSNRYTTGVTTSTTILEFYHQPPTNFSDDKLRDITQHIKSVATRHIVNYAEQFSLSAIDSHFLDTLKDSYFLHMLKTELFKSASSLVTNGIKLEEIIIEKIDNPITFSTSLIFIIVFSNLYDRKRMSFTIDTGNL